MPRRENVQYDHQDKVTNIGNRLRKFKTKTEADVGRFAKGLKKEAGGAAKRTIKKAASYLNPKKTATAAQAPPKRTPVKSPAPNIPIGQKEVGSPAQAIPRGKNAVQTRYNKNVVQPTLEGKPSPTLARGGTVSETRGLQDKTIGPDGTVLYAPDYVKTVGGAKNPYYDPEALRPGRRRTETGYFTDAPPPHLTITPFDTAEERASKQKGLESWHEGTSEFHTDAGVGRQSGLRERALAHVRGKYGLEGRRIDAAADIERARITGEAAVDVAKEGGIRGRASRRFDTRDIFGEEGEKTGEQLYDIYSGEDFQGPGAGTAQMPDFVAQFREGKLKSMDDLGRALKEYGPSSSEYAELLKQLTPSQQRFLQSGDY